MWPITLFATRRERLLAREEMQYALQDHGESAEAKLRWTADKTLSRERQRIYRLALKELAKQRASN